MKAILFTFSLLLLFKTSDAQQCSFNIPVHVNFIDGKKYGIKPGDVICIESGIRPFLQFRNIKGDSLHPVIIKNKGSVEISSTESSYGFKMHDCRYFTISGQGDSSLTYGIKISSTGPGANGLTIDGYSSDFEVHNLEITGTGFAGIMCKSDPECDGKYSIHDFVQKNISFHNNYIHHVDEEGFYIGNSFYNGYTRNKNCKGDTLKPHEIKNLAVFNNIIDSCGWEGIQIGCATENIRVFNNRITSFGYKNENMQNNGIQIGEGSGGYYFSNIVKNGNGNGFIILGRKKTVIYNNYIENAAKSGIFCDDRKTDDSTVIAVINNLIIHSGQNSLRWYNEKSKNIFRNNIMLHNTAHKAIETDNPAVNFEDTNNLITDNKDLIKLTIDPDGFYKPATDSPALRQQADISEFTDEINNPGSNETGVYLINNFKN